MQEGHSAQQDEHVHVLDPIPKELGQKRKAQHTEPAQEVMGELARSETPTGSLNSRESSLAQKPLPLRLALGQLASLIA